jgi:NADPH:quinone reductase-like Zn-dependent oxidoreductase
MRAVHLSGTRDAPVLRCEEAPDPKPGAGEILVRVRMAAITPSELTWAPTWTTRAGAPRTLPVIPGHEFSGEVAALGPGVTEVSVGEAVFGLNDWFADGAQAEYCVARASGVATRPRAVDDVQAAVAALSALTAWQGLIERARVTAGQRVLVHGASGSVGVFAVQLARWRGASVVGTAPVHNLDFVARLGADEVIDYRAERFEERVRDVDVVFDTVGGETLARSWAVLKPGGTMVTIAASEEQSREPRVRDAFFIVEPNRAQLGEIARLLETGVLRTTVGGIYPLAQVSAAYAFHPTRGKAVLRVGS